MLKRLPAVTDRAVWEKVTKGRAGIRWHSVVVRTSKDIGGNQKQILTVHGEVWGVQYRSKRKDRNKGKAGAKKQGEREEILDLRDMREVTKRDTE